MALTEFKLIRLIQAQIEETLGTNSEEARRTAKAIVHDINIAMDFSEEGVEQRPLRIDRQEEEPIGPLPPPPRSIIAPEEASLAKRLITMPGDKDFVAAETDQASGRKVIKPLSISRVGARPADHLPERTWWTPASLIQVIEQNTPPSIEFTPHGMPNDRHITVVRNIVNQAGLNTVNLQYAHPDASEDLGSTQGTVKIPLIAKITFSIHQKEIGIDDALANIMEQLKGMYAPRPKYMNPYLDDPGPLRPENAGDVDSEESRYDGNWRPIGPMTKLDKPITLKDGTVITQVADAKPGVMTRVKQAHIADSPLKR